MGSKICNLYATELTSSAKKLNFIQMKQRLITMVIALIATVSVNGQICQFGGANRDGKMHHRHGNVLTVYSLK